MFKNLTGSIAIGASLLFAGTLAVAGEVFTVDESTIPGTGIQTPFDADVIGGGRYNERVVTYADLNFASVAYATNFNFFLNNVLAPSLVGPSGCATCYNLYAVFEASGDISAPNIFNGTSGKFQFWMDPGSNTVFNNSSLTSLAAPASGGAFALPTAASNSADDYLLAFSNTIESSSVTVGLSQAFDFYFKDFTLTTVDQVGSVAGNQSGRAFFVAPVDFYVRVNVDGDIDALPVTITPGVPQDFLINGDVSAVFVIPEPGSLALVGLALLGLGTVNRRRS